MRRRLSLLLKLKRMLPRTLFARTLLIIVTPILLSQAVATYIFYDRHYETVANRLSFAVAGDISSLIDALDHAPSNAADKEIIQRAHTSMDLDVSWLPPTKFKARHSYPFRLYGIESGVLSRALIEKVGRPFEINPGIAPEWIAIDIPLEDRVLHVLCPERRLYTPTSYIFVIWMMGSAILFFTIAIMFMRNQIRPIKRLALAADRFGKGQEAPWFKPEGALEVRQAAVAFMIMRDRLRRQLDQRTAMLASVSHDLRTPLTRMKLELALLGKTETTEGLARDVEAMQAMIEGYLAFARGEDQEPRSPADLTQLIGAVISDARRSGVAIHWDETERVMLTLRQQAVSRALANLIGNAARHGSEIWVSLEEDEYGIEILIEDNGPGIPSDKREEVFKPFVRLDPARNADNGGVGLGLTIARDIVRQHGGDLLLEDSAHGGLKCVAKLPR